MKIFKKGFSLLFWTSSSFACLTGSIQGKDLFTGKKVSFATQFENAQKLGTVLVFLSANCPCSKSHEPVIEKLSKEFSNFQFVAVHSNQDEPEELAKKHFSESRLKIPIVQDPDAKLAKGLKALKTPHAFIIGPQGQCWFDGGIDDTRSAERATQHYLRNALSQLQKGKEPEEKVVRTLGCVIKR